MEEQLYAIVRGRVQGVNFRWYTVQRAQKLGLVGWVRNAVDGSVEVLAEGSRAQLDKLIEFLHEGSPSAKVTAVEVHWQSATHHFSDFSVYY